MDKIIIKNNTDLLLQDVLPFVNNVISSGKISTTGKGKQYCFLTTFDYEDMEIHVACDLNKKSDKFTIYERKY